MNPASSLVVIINSHPGVSTYDEPSLARFPQTIHHLRADSLYYLVSPEPISSPVGTTTDIIIYALGHNGAVPSPMKTISPAIHRQLSRLARRYKSTGGVMHLIGFVDLDSPHGSRKIIEPIIRWARALSLPLTLHLGVWHPTPNEFRSGLREMSDLMGEQIKLGSIFPVSDIYHPPALQRYVDELTGRLTSSPKTRTDLPIVASEVYDPEPIGPNDIFIVGNHSLHGLHNLVSALRDRGVDEIEPLADEPPPNAAASQLLNRHKHIIGFVTNQTYAQAFFGPQVDPYLEVSYYPSPSELLAALAAPDFGAIRYAHRTIVLTDSEISLEFDRRLDSFFQRYRERLHFYCFVYPRPNQTSVVFSNSPMSSASSLYSQIYASL